MSILHKDQEDFSPESWQDFFSTPMNTLIEGGTEGKASAAQDIGEQANSGFRDRYRLALNIVQLLTFGGLLVLGASILSQRDGTTAVASGELSPDIATTCEPIDLRDGASIPSVISCEEGQLLASGDLDVGWNGILSGWEVSPGFEVLGIWEAWETGTLEADGFEEWTGRDAHADTDPADNRYQEIRVISVGAGSFSIYENRGLTGKSATFTYEPEDGAAPPEPGDQAPAAFTPPTEGRRIAIQSEDRTSIFWDGKRSDDDVTVDWNRDPLDETSNTLLAASMMAEADAPIESLSGTLHLTPGDDGTDDGLSGGLFLRLYQERALGLAGGKSAQFGLVNTRMGAMVDRSSGICPHANCSGQEGVEYITAESVDLDASEGIGFEATVVDDVMTLTLWSLIDPEAPRATTSMPWSGGFGAAAVEVWATDWSFSGTVSNVITNVA